MILAIDPGRIKCGLAVMDLSAHVLEKCVAARNRLDFSVTQLAAKYAVNKVVVGHGTHSSEVERAVARLNLAAEIIFIPETDSTLEARTRYFKENPPPWYLRIIPVTLLPPPRPIDDYAAVILGERYLKG